MFWKKVKERQIKERQEIELLEQVERGELTSIGNICFMGEVVQFLQCSRCKRMYMTNTLKRDEAMLKAFQPTCFECGGRGDV